MDQSIFHFINGLAGKNSFFDGLGIFLGEYLGYVLVALVLIIFWKRWKKAFFIALSGLLAKFGLVEAIRLFWQRPRPFLAEDVNLLIEKSADPSFPSGHAAFFFAISTAVFLYNKKAGICFLFASVLISVFRVYIGVHWPADVLAGAAVGIFSGWLIIKTFKKF